MYLEPIKLESIHNPLSFLLKEDTSRYHNWVRNNTQQIFQISANDGLVNQTETSGFCIQHLTWDSDFFGFKIGKAHFYGTPTPSQIQEVISSAKKEGFKYIFTQIDCQSKSQRLSLQKNFFQLMETRLTYFIKLSEYNALERFKTRLAEERDIPALSLASASSINEHDRFHADPIFSREKADELMSVWVKASLTSSFSDGAMIVDAENPGAFCTFKTHKDHWDEWKLKISQPVFSAVNRNFKGWYIKIISELTHYLKNQGADYSYLTTQNTNPAVIKSWERLGYRFGSSEYIFSLSL